MTPARGLWRIGAIAFHIQAVYLLLFIRENAVDRRFSVNSGFKVYRRNLDSCQSQSVVESETQDRVHFIGQLVGLDRSQSDEFIVPRYLYLLIAGDLLSVRQAFVNEAFRWHWRKEPYRLIN